MNKYINLSNSKFDEVLKYYGEDINLFLWLCKHKISIDEYEINDKRFTISTNNKKEVKLIIGKRAVLGYKDNDTYLITLPNSFDYKSYPELKYKESLFENNIVDAYWLSINKKHLKENKVIQEALTDYCL